MLWKVRTHVQAVVAGNMYAIIISSFKTDARYVNLLRMARFVGRSIVIAR